MKRYFIGAMWAFAALLLLFLLGKPASAPDKAFAAPALSPASDAAHPAMTFYTRTLWTGNPIAGGLPGPIESSYDWVLYAISTPGCGHCGAYVTSIHLRNTVDNSELVIKSSVWYYGLSSGGATRGARNVQLFYPYVVWTQPGPTTPTSDYTYTAGDFTCTVCYYDLSTRKGGEIASLAALDATHTDLVSTLDVDRTGNVLALVGFSQPGSLWIGSVAGGQAAKLNATVDPQKVHEGMLLSGGGAAWIEADGQVGNLMYSPGGNTQASQIATSAQRLRGRGSPNIFWYASNGNVMRFVPMSANPLPAVVIAHTSVDYDIAYGSGPYGDLLGWVDNPTNGEQRTATLHVMSLGLNKELLTRKVDGPVYSFSQGLDHLAYFTSDQVGYPAFNVQMAWLLTPDPTFDNVWQRADAPVASGKAPRSWLWGPQPNYLGLEPYEKGPGGQRLVQYYDKSRMEVNNPLGDKEGPFYVTNGLLATELIGGEMQIGDATMVKASVPCTIPVAGDPRKDNPLTPGYATLAAVASIHGEHQAPNRTGQPVDDAIDVNGIISKDMAHAGATKYAAFSTQTGHNIPALFWTYLTGMQGTYGFDWTFVLGYPITEAYWTQMRISGKDYPVLVQAYQRRVLTYTPAFEPQWRVQQGNVGQHYFEWRYVMNNPGK